MGSGGTVRHGGGPGILQSVQLMWRESQVTRVYSFLLSAIFMMIRDQVHWLPHKQIPCCAVVSSHHTCACLSQLCWRNLGENRSIFLQKLCGLGSNSWSIRRIGSAWSLKCIHILPLFTTSTATHRLSLSYHPCLFSASSPLNSQGDVTLL